ncbi:hypothetical protein [Fibrobacter sp. UBA4297]|uniref:hypothetical protein n=1 Tax=Fibrobacter sp. UBA4297 TaxID=1946536 RepID=UPI0025C2501C|nr:hypothetical protein [Fibrobacter sp. UBA4297]
MNKSFKCYIDSATAQKALFEESINNVKDALEKAVAESTIQDDQEIQLIRKSEPVYSTGWLKGSLSYPWAIVSVIIPSIIENL